MKERRRRCVRTLVLIAQYVDDYEGVIQRLSWKAHTRAVWGV